MKKCFLCGRKIRDDERFLEGVVDSERDYVCSDCLHIAESFDSRAGFKQVSVMVQFAEKLFSEIRKGMRPQFRSLDNEIVIALPQTILPPDIHRLFSQINAGYNGEVEAQWDDIDHGYEKRYD